MAYFAGLDVSVKETSVCIVDDAGKIVREARVASEPEALLHVRCAGIDIAGREPSCAVDRLASLLQYRRRKAQDRGILSADRS